MGSKVLSAADSTHSEPSLVCAQGKPKAPSSAVFLAARASTPARPPVAGVMAAAGFFWNSSKKE